MPVLSYVHELFNVAQCQAYIHTLRWKDRPLQCPRCLSHDVDPWGTYHYRPGCKRYWCNGCKRTFNDLTPMKQRVRGASSNGALRRKGRTPPDPQKQFRPSCCKKIISYTG